MNADDTAPPDLPEDTGPEPGPDFSELDLSDLPPDVVEKTKQFAEQAYVNNLASHLGEIPPLICKLFVLVLFMH